MLIRVPLGQAAACNPRAGIVCQLATSSFIVLELYAAFAPAASIRLAALRDWLDVPGNEVLLIVCLVLGFWLTGQSIRLLAIAGVGES